MIHGQRTPPETDILHTDSRCRPLLRLRQLATEIAAASERNDLNIVERATALLPDAVEQCRGIDPDLARQNVEVMRFISETHKMLSDCDATLQNTKADIATELRRVRMTQKNREWVQQNQRAVVGRRLDTSK